jgi:hypothetical protein
MLNSRRKTMPIKVWEEKSIEKDIYLKLEDYKDEITLAAVDENGNSPLGSNLLTINKKTFKVYKHCGINSKLGFDLDAHGKLKIEGEW